MTATTVAVTEDHIAATSILLSPAESTAGPRPTDREFWDLVGALSVQPGSPAPSPQVSPQSGPPLFAGSYWIAGDGVRFPIKISLQYADGGYLAAAHEIMVFGGGSSAADAVMDLRAALREHLEALADEGSLSDELQAQRDFLRLHIAP